MLPLNFEKLAAAVALNRLDNLQIVQAAAADKAGHVYYTGDQAWAAVTDIQTQNRAVALTVDSIVDRNKSKLPVVFKIDVEGYEYEVLKGATKAIDALRPLILFESIENQPDNSNEKLAKRFLADLGYNLFLIYRKILAPRRPDDPQEAIVSDFLAVPKEKMTEAQKVLGDYAFRPLTRWETGVWLNALSLNPVDVVRRHAESFLVRTGLSIPFHVFHTARLYHRLRTLARIAYVKFVVRRGQTA